MKEKLLAWIEVTGTAILTLGLLASVGLATYLLIRVIYVGVTLSSLTVR